MLEAILYGAIQGLVEWLPVSSEAVLVMVQNMINADRSTFDAIRFALFLHLGTTISAIIYFRKEIYKLLRFGNLFTMNRNGRELYFYVIASAISIGVAALIVILLKNTENMSETFGGIMTLVIGGLLMATAYLQYRMGKHKTTREREELTTLDAIIAGAGQGLAALPGISRSGTTTAFLLLRNIDQEKALVASFIMSIPFVLIGNIALNLNEFAWSWESAVALVTAAVIGYISIDAFLKFARRYNFALVVFIFALVVVVSGVVSLV